MIITAILLICKPSAFLTLVIVLFGIGTVIEGLAHIINYIFLSKEEKIYSYEILEGILGVPPQKKEFSFNPEGLQMLDQLGDLHKHMVELQKYNEPLNILMIVSIA